LGDIEFTRPELAGEADLHKPTIYRIVHELENEGVILKVRSKRPVTFRVSRESGRLRLLAAFVAALRILDRHPERQAQVVDGFRRLALRSTGLASGRSRSRPDPPRSALIQRQSAWP
jgi:DNA-binding MarR family transcriptional regulator